MSQAAEREADEKIAVAMEFAETKLSLTQMIDTIWLQIHIIQGSQRARLLAGLIEQPNDDEIQRAALLMAVLRFLETCRDQPDQAIAWLRSKR